MGAVFGDRRSMRCGGLKAIVVAAGLGLLALTYGCAEVPTDPDAKAAYDERNDPYEPMNRYFFDLNNAMDELVLKPFAGWYYILLPNFAQDGVRNALNNLRTPVILGNDLLQGDLDRAGITVARFFINSTLGIAGLFDVASKFGLIYHDEDFGQTLAVWGTGEGPYLVLPLLGPSNPRDATGRGVDMAMDPLTWILPMYDLGYLGYIRAGVDAVDLRARNLKTLDEIKQGAIDYYATIRSLYRQHRNDEIRNGAPPDSVSVLDYITDPQTSEAP
jgi:phospholipid-binding lipoprotein MlaA